MKNDDGIYDRLVLPQYLHSIKQNSNIFNDADISNNKLALLIMLSVVLLGKKPIYSKIIKEEQGRLYFVGD